MSEEMQRPEEMPESESTSTPIEPDPSTDAAEDRNKED